MTPLQRIVLFLLAVPFSGTLAAGAYVLLDFSPLMDGALALAVFLASELLLQRLASRIPAKTGVETLPGREAEALADFQPDEVGGQAGYVRVDGERWRARLAGAGSPPRVGDRVRIQRVDGLTLWVALPRRDGERRRSGSPT